MTITILMFSFFKSFVIHILILRNLVLKYDVVPFDWNLVFSYIINTIL